MNKTAGLLLTLLLVAGCAHLGAGGGATPSAEPSGDPAGAKPDLAGAWVLATGHGPQGRIEVPDSWRVTLNFTGGEFGGQACNHYGGNYQLAGDGRISLSPGHMTEMACEEPMMTVEYRYHAALGAVNRASRDGDRLTLTGNDTELTFDLQPPVPDAALQGPRWTLDSLIESDAVSTVRGDGWLTLRADGTFSGSTGCREFDGEYLVYGDEVQVTNLVMADNPCTDGLEEQDSHVVGVIEGFTIEIEGDRMTISARGGSGLGYRAAGG